MKYDRILMILILSALLLALSACGRADDASGRKKDKKRTEESDAKDAERAGEVRDEYAWMGDYLSEAEELLDRYRDESDLMPANPEDIMLFDFTDINGDGVPEMISFDRGGVCAWITMYTDGETVTKKLFDNDERPIGATDYGADAKILSEEQRIMVMEYDSTYEKDGGMNKPGAEWDPADLDVRPFDYLTYLTIYRIDPHSGLEKTDKYQRKIHYEPADGELKEESVKASHNKEPIGEEEFLEVMEKGGGGDVCFGSAQDSGTGLYFSGARELLSGGNLTFSYWEDPYESNERDENVTVSLLDPDDQYGYYYSRNVKRSKLPSDIKPDDTLLYSFQNGWQKKGESPEADIPADGEWKEAYARKVREYYEENRQYEDEWTQIGYNLIYFDDDDIPELVTGISGSRVSLYTYRDNRIVPIFEDWGYGAFGNAGYEYLVRQSVVTGADADYAGALYWTYFLKWDPDTGELNDINDQSLSCRYFRDLNGDGEPQDDEYLPDDDVLYYYGDQEVSKEEYDSHCLEGDIQGIFGDLSYLEILKELGASSARELGIASAEATSELDVASKDNATYHAANLYDNNLKTAWVEGTDGDGEGETITLRLDEVHKIEGLKIYNGFLNTKRRYAINGKVKKVNIDYGNGYSQTADLIVMYQPEDDTEIESYQQGETLIIPMQPVETDTIKITIAEAESGSKYHDTAISEIVLYGE